MDIKGKNLIARELQTHDKCYRDYTHTVWEKETTERQNLS